MTIIILHTNSARISDAKTLEKFSYENAKLDDFKVKRLFSAAFVRLLRALSVHANFLCQSDKA